MLTAVLKDFNLLKIWGIKAFSFYWHTFYWILNCILKFTAIKMTHCMYSWIPPQRSTKYSVLIVFSSFFYTFISFCILSAGRTRYKFYPINTKLCKKKKNKTALLCKTEILIFQSPKDEFSLQCQECFKGKPPLTGQLRCKYYIIKGGAIVNTSTSTRAPRKAFSFP